MMILLLTAAFLCLALLSPTVVMVVFGVALLLSAATGRVGSALALAACLLGVLAAPVTANPAGVSTFSLLLGAGGAAALASSIRIRGTLAFA